MTLQVAGAPGETVVGDGVATQTPARTGRLNDLIVSELRGRFAEMNFRGRLFSGGMTAATSLAAATFTTATTGATATPIVGIWNPFGNTKNAVVLQAMATFIVTALQAGGLGACVWMASVGNTAVPSTGVVAFNRSTLKRSGSAVVDVSGVAITGAAVALALVNGSAIGGGPLINASTLQTAAGLEPAGAAGVENVEGAFIVPPGGILALMCTTQPVAVSAVSGILWTEEPTS